MSKVEKGIKNYEKNKELYLNFDEDQIINSKKAAKGLKKIISRIKDGKFRNGKNFISRPGLVDLSWMNDSRLYNQICQEIFARYNADSYSGNNFNELIILQSFLDDINNEHVKDKKLRKNILKL